MFRTQPDAAPVWLTGAVVVLGVCLSYPVSSSPDGAEWETVEHPDGCMQCHLDSPPPDDSAALSIEGLPMRPESGQSYDLTIVLNDPELKNAGFLLSIRSESTMTGELRAAGEKIETNGAQARSTWDSSWPDGPGEARWQLIWTAPPAFDATLRFDLWGNAGNDDLSPLGDRTHHRIWQIPPTP